MKLKCSECHNTITIYNLRPDKNWTYEIGHRKDCSKFMGNHKNKLTKNYKGIKRKKEAKAGQ